MVDSQQSRCFDIKSLLPNRYELLNCGVMSREVTEQVKVNHV